MARWHTYDTNVRNANRKKILGFNNVDVFEGALNVRYVNEGILTSMKAKEFLDVGFCTEA